MCAGKGTRAQPSPSPFTGGTSLRPRRRAFRALTPMAPAGPMPRRRRSLFRASPSRRPTGSQARGARFGGLRPKAVNWRSTPPIQRGKYLKYPSIERVPGGASNDLIPNLQKSEEPGTDLGPRAFPEGLSRRRRLTAHSWRGLKHFGSAHIIVQEQRVRTFGKLAASAALVVGLPIGACGGLDGAAWAQTSDSATTPNYDGASVGKVPDLHR